MKLRILALALVCCGVAAAQNPYIAIEGAFTSADGVSVSLAQTTLAVDVTVAHDKFISGPYARYAQKFFGMRAPLADKESWSIVEASVAIVDGTSHIAAGELPPTKVEYKSYTGAEEEFSRLQADKLSMTALSLEEAAQTAAKRIFMLRNRRQEHILGETGEGVFSGGLDAALKEIDRLEQSYLELFFGKNITTTSTERYCVMPDLTKRQYIVCRFSPSAGLLPATDLSGEVVLLEINPSGNLLGALLEAAPKDMNVVKCRVADPATCTVSCQGEAYTSVVLPIFEFGRTINVSLGRSK